MGTAWERAALSRAGNYELAGRDGSNIAAASFFPWTESSNLNFLLRVAISRVSRRRRIIGASAVLYSSECAQCGADCLDYLRAGGGREKSHD